MSSLFHGHEVSVFLQAFCVGNMLRQIIRSKPTTRCLHTSTIGERIKDKNDLDSFFEKSSWSTQDLLQDGGDVVDQKIIDGLLDLSGLSKNISLEERHKISNSLTSQINLIAKLNDADTQSQINGITRLVDDKHVDVITLDALLKSIPKINPALSKGEIENSWNPLCLASESQNRYYVVREGLEKNNK